MKKYTGKYPKRISIVSGGYAGNKSMCLIELNDGTKLLLLASELNYNYPKCGTELSAELVQYGSARYDAQKNYRDAAPYSDDSEAACAIMIRTSRTIEEQKAGAALRKEVALRELQSMLRNAQSWITKSPAYEASLSAEIAAMEGAA